MQYKVANSELVRNHFGSFKNTGKKKNNDKMIHANLCAAILNVRLQESGSFSPKVVGRKKNPTFSI